MQAYVSHLLRLLPPLRVGVPSRVSLLALLPMALAASTLQAQTASVMPDPRATALIAELGLKQDQVASRDHRGWQRPRLVVVANGDADMIKRMQAMVPGVEVQALASGQALRAQLARTEVLMGSCDPDLVTGAPKLRWIQTFWVGVESCVGVPGLAERGILLSNAQRTSAIPIAEHAIAMMLSLTRQLPAYARSQQSGTWQDNEVAPEPRELTGSTMLVVGLGGIGTEVARRAHGLGMRVIATRNSSRDGPDFVDKVGLSDELLALATEADVVVNAAPLTAATTGIFDKRFFDALKPGTTFINIARGKSVVTNDLVAALRSGRLGGAALDVTDPEPLTDGHPLWAMHNVIITPHIAAQSSVQSERYVLLTAENLRRYAAGEALLNVVDIKRGY